MVPVVQILACCASCARTFSMTEPRVPSICQHLSRFDARGVSFSAGEQEDAHELWVAISDKLCEIYPPFARSFSIGVESALVCSNCGLLPFHASEGHGSTVFELHS